MSGAGGHGLLLDGPELLGGSGGGGGAPQSEEQRGGDKRKCSEVANLPGEDTDIGAFARLIFQEATPRSDFAGTSAPWSYYFLELFSIAAVVINRVDFLNQPGLRQSQTLGFGNVGASLRDVIFSGGRNPDGRSFIPTQFEGFSRGGRISNRIRKRIAGVLNSSFDSEDCQKLLDALHVARLSLERGSYSPQNLGLANIFAMRTADSGAPGGSFYQLPMIPGSRNVFYGLR